MVMSQASESNDFSDSDYEAMDIENSGSDFSASKFKWFGIRRFADN